MNMKWVLVYYILILLTMTGWAVARADTWVGPDCTMAWDHSTPDVVQGYHVVCDGTQAGDTPDQTITCVALGITQGHHECYVTAYNPTGESGASNTLPFVFTVSAPDAPTGVSVSP